MKPSNSRRYRRARRPAKSDGAFFKKESVQEQSFFGESSHDAFFRPALSSVVAPVQRKCDHCAEEEKTQRKEDKKEEEKKLQRVKDDKEEEKKLKRAPDKKEEEDKKLQRATDKKEEDDKKLQRAPDKKEEEDKKKVQKKEAAGSSPTTSMSSYVGSLSGGGQSLPHQTNQFFSARMGYDFSDVKVHTDKEAAESAKDINAKAYTTGNHIVFNEGQYNDGSAEGKKLLAHELVHVIQQDDGTLNRKGEEEPECTAGSVDLEAETTAGFSKGAGTMAKEKTVKSKGCEGCEDECVSITGTLNVPFKVSTQINLPTVPPGLTECQQERVSAAINGPLTVHEKKHVSAFETFNGTAALPVNFKGCEGDYVSFQEGLAETEFQRREAAAKAKSAKLDPFTVPVDLCCKDKPKK